jgi:hypothetical protein
MAYLREKRKYRQEGRPTIYVDETYLHRTHTTPHEWADDSTAGVKAPMSTGQRLIIVHRGNLLKNQITIWNAAHNQYTLF